MKFVGKSSVAAAFEAWGRFEAASRARSGVEGFDVGLGEPLGFQSAINVVLTVRAPMTWRILKASPKRCGRVLFGPDDAGDIIIADGRTLDAWTDAVAVDLTQSGHDVQAMAARPDPILPPLICVRQDGEADAPVAPLVLLDGWHRAAAWRLHARAGRLYPVEGFVIVTKDRMQMLTEDDDA